MLSDKSFLIFFMEAHMGTVFTQGQILAPLKSMANFPLILRGPRFHPWCSATLIIQRANVVLSSHMSDKFEQELSYHWINVIHPSAFSSLHQILCLGWVGFTFTDIVAMQLSVILSVPAMPETLQRQADQVTGKWHRNKHSPERKGNRELSCGWKHFLRNWVCGIFWQFMGHDCIWSKRKWFFAALFILCGSAWNLADV